MTQDVPQLSSTPAPKRGRIRAPQDLIAGVSLMVLALGALWAAGDLSTGRLGAPGPGLLPRVVAVLVGAVGAALVSVSFLRQGEVLERWSLRGPLFVCLGVVAFALTIRAPGLCVAGPLVVMVTGAASPETRFRELALFALAMTAICVGLFRYLLHLPIPILVIRGLVTI
jgi:putative tricarboxylic transport membrane protein